MIKVGVRRAGRWLQWHTWHSLYGRAAPGGLELQGRDLEELLEAERAELAAVAALLVATRRVPAG